MAAAHRWRLRAPGNKNRETSPNTQLAGRIVLAITVLAMLSAAGGAVALTSSTGTSSVPPAAVGR